MNIIDVNFYPFYGKLNPVQKSVYRYLLSKIEEAQVKVAMPVKCSSDAVFEAMSAIYYDRPDLFWYEGVGTAVSVGRYVSTVEIKYNSLFTNLTKNKDRFEKEIQSYIKRMPGRNNIEQLFYIHDRLVSEVSYAQNSLGQTSYSALVNKKSVCAGYTRALQVLLQRVNIPCYYCAGQATNSTKHSWERHAWNIIKLGSDFYNIDVTWDDCYGDKSGRISYTYFNCTDFDIAQNHRRDEMFKFLPKCTGKNYTFEKCKGVSPELYVVIEDGVTIKELVTDHQSLVKVLIKEIRKSSKRTREISFPVYGAHMAANAKKWIEDVITKEIGKTHQGWSGSIGYVDYNNGYYRFEVRYKII